MRFKIEVKLKPEVLDPEGRAILHMVHGQGLDKIRHIAAYKTFLVDVEDGHPNPREAAEQIAKDYLTNPVSHTYSITEDH